MKPIIISSIIALALIGGAFVLTRPANLGEDASANNVSMVNGTQVIDLRAKGGYTPRRSTAKAGIPTVLKINTKGTFDCSSIVRIPSLNVYQNLPTSGITEIDLGTPKTGLLQGSCGMGMYPFEINFQG
jgi:plastocyanin domain-containing protein